MYDNYVKARDTSWEVLLRCGIKELPITLGTIADYYNFKVIAYSDTNITQVLKNEVVEGDGFIVFSKGKKEIFLNDKVNNRNRRRFTLAHELGHGILNHNIDIVHYRNSEVDSDIDMQELEANVFARDILMPSTILAALNIHTPEEIMKVCDVSRKSAEIRAARMELLYKRNLFNLHPMERKVREQFDKFIRNYRKNCRKNT
ncbi:MAG: ImmA/IrrE family metallo-endopeptidase [Lachnospiraceae bacterium]|nr:ImmA/IrrE family metallo-endopeptidase [Lachnospiraceae bacterium]